MRFGSFKKKKKKPIKESFETLLIRFTVMRRIASNKTVLTKLLAFAEPFDEKKIPGNL